MRKFIVPQFIDVESKIFGPITTRQFLIILSGLLVGFLAYKLSDFTLFLLEAFVIFVLIIAFAFAKVNGAPFHIFLLNYIVTLKSPKIRIWKREPYQKPATLADKDKKIESEIIVKKRTSPVSNLSELSLIVDTGGAYRGEGAIEIDNNINQVNEEQTSKK